MRWLGGIAAALVILVVGALIGSALSQRPELVPGVAAPLVRAPPGERIRVEVLNAGGVVGVARAATERLREGGFDVVYFGNAEEFGPEPSVVLDRSGRLDRARTVADALGIRNVRSEPDSNLYLDVSVRLGREWAPPSAVRDEAPPTRAWWDPRRWLGR